MSRITKVVVTGPATRVEVDGAPLQTIVHGEQQLNLVNVGPPGPPGAAATVHLLGTLDDPSELPTPGSVGDGWMIDGDVWVWTAEGEWINVGPIRGPQGVQGPVGPVGPPGPTEPYVRLGSNLSSPHHLGQLPEIPGGLDSSDVVHVGRPDDAADPASGVQSYGVTPLNMLRYFAAAFPVGSQPILPPGVFAVQNGDQLEFRKSNGDTEQTVPSTFARASQAWNGHRLLGTNQMRVLGRYAASPVVLIEGQRTNLINRSADFSADTSPWTAASDFAITPVPGLTTGETGWHHENISTLQNRARVYTQGVWTGSPETFSITLGRGTSPSSTVSMFNNSTSQHIVRASINWETNTAAVSSGVGSVATEWLNEDTVILRVTATGPTGAARRIIIYPTPFNQSGEGQTLTIYRAQLEEEPFASSYIPTDGAPATRANEILRLDEAAPKLALVGGVATTINVAFRKMEPSHSDGLGSIFGFGHSSHTHADRLLNLSIRRFGDVGFVTYGLGANRSFSLPDSGLGDVPWGEWMVITLTFPGDGTVRSCVNGQGGDAVLHQFTDVPSDTPLFDRLIIGQYAYTFSAAYAVNSPIAPGAAALGIPFIDNRAWSAAEIQAAHARWLPELERIEVPV